MKNEKLAKEILARLDEFWADPVPDRFTQKMPRRIAGSSRDQDIPEGILNPYWEIVRQMPVGGVLSSASGRSDPASYWFMADILQQSPADRDTLARSFAWSVPSPGDITWIKERLGGRGVAELGAGLGYWSWQLSQMGVDVVAYDPAVPAENQYTRGRSWFPVVNDDHRAIKSHPDRTMLMCWPGYRSSWPAEALAAYTGNRLFYVGEDQYGCCADDDFFDLLYKEWEDAGSSPYHVTFSGIHCTLSEYRRIND